MCRDCVNARELLRNVAFDGHKVRPIKHFQAEDYESLLKRQSFCSQQYHEREVTRFFCLECQTCVCQVCVVTDHRNHAVDPLDKAADREKAQIMTGADLMKEKTKIFIDVIREFEQTVLNLETNIATAKREISQVAEQMITKIREREREAITTLENTRVSRTDKLNSVKTQVQSLVKQINQAIEFADNLVQRSSSSDILQSRKSLEQRFEDLNKTPVPSLPVTSFVKFIHTSEPENLTLGFVVTSEPVVEGLTQDFQAGVEAELIIYPKLTSGVQEKIHVDVVVEPPEKVGSLMISGKEDGNLLVKFTAKVPHIYNIQVTLNMGHLHYSIFTGYVQVNERQIQVVGELNLKGETLQPSGIAVNTEGLIAVADYSGNCILLFDKEGNYLRKFGCRGSNVGQLNGPYDITFLNDGEILVADVLNQRIQQFNVYTGKVLKAFGKKGKGEGELQRPVSVRVDDEGRVLVADSNRIQVFTKDGEPVFSFGASGLEKLNRPSDCIFQENTFIVSDAKNHSLKIFNNSGKFLRKIGEQGKGDGQLDWSRGLCVEKRGNHHNILVCDSNNQRIVQFTMEGLFTGKTVTKLQEPVRIATTPDKRILVSDFAAKKVYILQ